MRGVERLDDVFTGAWARSNLSRDRTAVVVLLDADEWLPGLAQAERLLDPEERQRVSRLRRRSDAIRRTLGYALNRLVLARLLDCDPERVPLYRDALGAPRLGGDVRAWVSLSHADEHCAIAFSGEGVVGVDIEPVSRRADVAGIAEWICHPDEYEALRSLAAKPRDSALLALWVRKEALLKAAGTGLSIEMAGFTAPPDSTLALPDGTPASVALRMLDTGMRTVAAAATPAHQPVRVVRLSPDWPDSEPSAVD